MSKTFSRCLRHIFCVLDIAFPPVRSCHFSDFWHIVGWHVQERGASKRSAPFGRDLIPSETDYACDLYSTDHMERVNKVGYVIFCLNGSGPTEGFLCFRAMRTNRPWFQPSPSHNHSGKYCLITFYMTREVFFGLKNLVSQMHDNCGFGTEGGTAQTKRY